MLRNSTVISFLKKTSREQMLTSTLEFGSNQILLLKQFSIRLPGHELSSKGELGSEFLNATGTPGISIYSSSCKRESGLFSRGISIKVFTSPSGTLF